MCGVWYKGWVTGEKVIIIIINTTTKEVIIYRVLTTFTHGIKCFMGLLGKARRHGTVGKTVDSGDTLPKWRLSSLLYCLGHGAATSLFLSSHQRSRDNDRAYLTGLVQGLGKLIHVKFWGQGWLAQEDWVHSFLSCPPSHSRFTSPRTHPFLQYKRTSKWWRIMENVSVNLFSCPPQDKKDTSIET